MSEGDGTINGFISLIDSFGNEIKNTDFSGVVISVEGGPQFTRSDGDGQFTLANIPKQKITLIFSKSGFAETHHVDYDYKGLQYQYYGTRKLFQISRLTPNIVLRPFESAGDTTKPYEKAMFSSRLTDTAKNNQYTGLIKLYFGRSAFISPLDPNSFQFSTPLSTVDFYEGKTSFAIYRDTLLNNGFQPASKIYVAAYCTGFHTKNEFFISNTTGNRIYTGLSPYHSEVKSFILP